MPLIDITCKSDFFPEDQEEPGTLLVDHLGSDLPDMCVEHREKLGLESDTPPEGVQVDYHQFHSRAVNAPDVWVKVQFSEPYPGDVPATEITGHFKQLIFGWFEADGSTLPGIAVDCFWGPTHGFLKFGDTAVDW